MRWLLLLLALVSCGLLAGGPHVSRGYAYAIDEDTLLFEERREVLSSERHKLTYTGPDGVVWMVKELDFSLSQIQPSLERLDPRTQRFESIEVAGQKVKMAFDPNGQKRKDHQVTLPTNLIVDAGFENFVSQNFEKLTAGEVQVIQFAVPSRGKCYTFKLSKLEESTFVGEPVLVLRMVPANALFRLFVDPIILRYHRENHRLMRFDGMSGVTDLDGDFIPARMVFPEPGQKPEDYLESP